MFASDKDPLGYRKKVTQRAVIDDIILPVEMPHDKQGGVESHDGTHPFRDRLK